MQIKFDKGARCVATLESVPAGECFMLPTGATVYIKTGGPVDCFGRNSVVNLATGYLYFYELNRSVVPVMAEVHVADSDGE